MLSNTSGLKHYARSLGFHSDDLTKLSKVCRLWRETGRCQAYSAELDVRRQIGAAKEAELLKRATALYTMQTELMADMMAEGSCDSAEAAALTHGGFSADPAKRTEVIGKLVEELKREPAYLNWSLDAAVAERLVELKVRPCPFSHRGDVQQALKRSRSATDMAEAQLQQQHTHETTAALHSATAPASSSSATIHVAAPDADAETSSSASADESEEGEAREWTAERHRIFASLSPLQRCVVCLLWQRRFRVVQGLVADVRLTLEKYVTAQYQATGRAGPPPPAVMAAAADAGLPAQLPRLASSPEHGSSSGRAAADEGEGEDALEAYLSSAAFEELVETEAQRVVTRVAFRPELGLVDLSALPQLVAHMSTHPSNGIVLARTLTYFTGKQLRRSAGAARSAAAASPKHHHNDAPAPVSFAHLLFPGRQAITEKELDLSTTARADEVVEALEWTLQAYHREAQLRGEAGISEDAAHVSVLFRHQHVRLHGLTMKRCLITSADGLVESLRKRHLEHFLYALDLSENRLWSLRFLLVLRAHYAQRLLRLSLRSNPITRKPEYQEQVRTSLPQLTSLDGEPIRRPPLQLPKPWPASCMRWSAADGSPEQQAQEAVLDCVARLLYIWETHRIPHTARELESWRDAGRPAPPEEELNEDNFPHRYLHPAAAFSVAMAPGLKFFDAATMRDARSVELETSYAGMRLSAVDVRDARVFDVAMKSSSRNLLAGRPALQRYGRGAENCYMAYQYTIYPDRMDVQHHLSSVVVSVACVPDVVAVTPAPAERRSDASAKGKRRKTGPASASGATAAAADGSGARFGALARRTAPQQQHIVTLHGVMTWRLPSMKGSECLRAAYTRVLTLTKKVLPAQNREWERLRSPPYVLMNDQVFLLPTAAAAPTAATALMPAVYVANTPPRLARLVVEFGLEACRDGAAFVRDVVERCTSPASEYAALQALVLGVLGPTAADAQSTQPGKEAEADGAQLACARAAHAPLSRLFDAHLRVASPVSAARQYVVFSALDGATAAAPSTAATPSVAADANAADVLAWAAARHVVPVSLLHDVTSVTNECYTLAFK